MEELEARANRFVSLLAGSTVKPKVSPSSSKLRPSQLAVPAFPLRADLLLERLFRKPGEPSGQPSDPTSQTT